MRNNFAKKLGMSLAAFGLVATSMFSVQDAEAVPAFARQTGMPCNACHFQNFPSINAMGRSFKAGNFTMEGSQEFIEGENGMKLPSSLNIGAVIKMRHTKTNGDYTVTGEASDYGEVEFPDEAALLIGGRVADGIGALWEVNIAKGPELLLGSKLAITAAEMGDTRLSVIPYKTDGQGVGYGFELLNTASLGLQRYSESKIGAAPVQLGFVDAAVGINLVASNPNWYVTLNQFAPAFPINAVPGNLTALATYLRAVYMTDLAGFDFAAGLGTYSGTAKSMQAAGASESGGGSTAAAGGGTEVEYAPAGMLIDVQMLGEIAGMSAGIFFTTGSVPAAATDATAATNPFNAEVGNKAKSATGLAAKLGVTPDLSVVVQTGSKDEGSGTSVSMSDVGVQYMIAQNVKFEYNVETDDTVTKNQAMLFLSF